MCTSEFQHDYTYMSSQNVTYHVTKENDQDSTHNYKIFETCSPPKQLGSDSFRSVKAVAYESALCPLWIRTAIGNPPACVAVKRTVTVDKLASQLDVESTNICSAELGSFWTLDITGVTTKTAQLSLPSASWTSTAHPVYEVYSIK